MHVHFSDTKSIETEVVTFCHPSSIETSHLATDNSVPTKQYTRTSEPRVLKETVYTSPSAPDFLMTQLGKATCQEADHVPKATHSGVEQA